MDSRGMKVKFHTVYLLGGAKAAGALSDVLDHLLYIAIIIHGSSNELVTNIDRNTLNAQPCSFRDTMQRASLQ